MSNSNTVYIRRRILKNRPVEVKPVTLKDKPLVEHTDKHKKTISSEKGLAIGW